MTGSSILLPLYWQSCEEDLAAHFMMLLTVPLPWITHWRIPARGINFITTLLPTDITAWKITGIYRRDFSSADNTENQWYFRPYFCISDGAVGHITWMSVWQIIHCQIRNYDMTFWTKHAPDASLIARPGDQDLKIVHKEQLNSYNNLLSSWVLCHSYRVTSQQE